MKKMLVLALLAMNLTACAGSGSETVVIPPQLPLPRTPTPEELARPAFDEQLNVALNAERRVLGSGETGQVGYSGTQFRAIPAFGTTQFNGFGVIGLTTGTGADLKDIFMLGDAVLNVDFVEETLSGAVTDFAAATRTIEDFGQGLDAADYDLVDGRITISGGDFDDAQPNRIVDVQFGGILRLDGEDYFINGVAEGQFLGTRAEDTDLFPIKALAISDTTGFALVAETR